MCSVNACQPSRNSRAKFGAVAVLAREESLIALRSSALVAYVPPSSRRAYPLPIVATSVPPTAAPSGNAMYRAMLISPLACCSSRCETVSGTSPVDAGE